ncbi:MAG TPA: hypothetical protein VF808_11950 [Ktedonobacterales bacterium]
MPGASKDSTPISAENPNYVSRSAELGDFTVAFETLRAGADPAPFFKGLSDDRCPCPHWGLVVSGRLIMRYRDHQEIFEPGDAFYLTPGHLPLAPTDTEIITFSPTTELMKVNVVMAKNRTVIQS